MSFIYRDFLTPARFQWSSNWKLFRRFDAVWPKTTIDGIPVYANTMVYWSGSLRSDAPFKKFLTALGVEYAQLQNSNYDGVENVYFKLEPGKYSYTAPGKSAIVTDLNTVFNINDEFEVFVHYSGESRRVVSSHWLYDGVSDPTKMSSYTVDTLGIRTTLHSDPMLYFANARRISAGIPLQDSNLALGQLIQTVMRSSPVATPVTRVEYDEDVTHIYATLALLDNGSVFQQQGGAYSERTTVNQVAGGDVYFEYSYKLKFKVIADAAVNSYVVGQIDLLSNAIQTALTYTGGNIQAISNAATDTTLKEAVISMNNPEVLGLTYNGQLRVDAVGAMKKKAFVEMLSKIFGSGYTKKKVKWYEKALAFTLIIIAVVIGIASGGGLAAVSSSLVSLAIALSVTAAVLSLSLLVYASAFPHATDQTRMIGRFAQIVGLAAMVTGVMAAIQNAWQRAAAEAVKRQAISETSQYTLKQFAQDMFSNMVDAIKSSVSSSFSTITTPSSWSLPELSKITVADVSGWMGNLGDGIKLYTKFFGDSDQLSTLTEGEQATKEDGVESVYLSYEMIDNTDALYRMDNMIKNNNGGQKTENYMVQIT